MEGKQNWSRDLMIKIHYSYNITIFLIAQNIYIIAQGNSLKVRLYQGTDLPARKDKTTLTVKESRGYQSIQVTYV